MGRGSGKGEWDWAGDEAAVREQLLEYWRHTAGAQYRLVLKYFSTHLRQYYRLAPGTHIKEDDAVDFFLLRAKALAPGILEGGEGTAGVRRRLVARIQRQHLEAFPDSPMPDEAAEELIAYGFRTFEYDESFARDVLVEQGIL